MRKRKNPYNEQEVFREARAGIKNWFGLDLTLIELARLKEYVPKVIKERLEIDGRKHPHAPFDPSAETMGRFMTDYYGIPPNHLNAIAGMWGDTCPFLAGEYNPKLKQLMRIYQERAHLP